MISFSLKAKAKPADRQTPQKPPAPLGSFEDEPFDAAPTATSSSRADVNKRLSAMNAGLTTKAQKKRMESEKKVDQTVYQYDEVYDRLQEAKEKAKQAKEAESKHREPKYIKNLLMTAETRRLDYLRAEEKMIQRERDAEGDEFADKDRFVTQAYKDQMEAVRKAEQEEKEREGRPTLSLALLSFT